MWSVLEFLWVALVRSAQLSFGCDIRDEELLEAGGMCFLLRDHSRAALLFFRWVVSVPLHGNNYLFYS